MRTCSPWREDVYKDWFKAGILTTRVFLSAPTNGSRYICLQYGIPAPGIFHRAMEILLQGIPGVIHDILVPGENEPAHLQSKFLSGRLEWGYQHGKPNNSLLTISAQAYCILSECVSVCYRSSANVRWVCNLPAKSLLNAKDVDFAKTLSLSIFSLSFTFTWPRRQFSNIEVATWQV